MSWPSSEYGEKSWYTPRNVAAKYNYPFSSALYNIDPFYIESKDVVEYESFAVEAKGDVEDEQNFTSMISAMESMILNSPDEIQERQLALKKHVISLLYGVDADAHRYDDAFARILKVLEAYVHKVIIGRLV